MYIFFRSGSNTEKDAKQVRYTSVEILRFLQVQVIITINKPHPTTTRKEGRKEMFYLMTHSTHFIYGYMASDIW